MNWISVKDKLPEIDIEVIVYAWELKIVSSGYLKDENSYDRKKARKPEKYPPKLYWVIEAGNYLEMNEVTHWMPLPSPPKDKK